MAGLRPAVSRPRRPAAVLRVVRPQFCLRDSPGLSRRRRVVRRRPLLRSGDGERWLAVRDMFLNEFGGYDGSEQSLWLLQAIPREWLRPGNRMSVERMGTLFGGTVDLAVQVAEDGNSLDRRCQTRQTGRQATKNPHPPPLWRQPPVGLRHRQRPSGGGAARRRCDAARSERRNASNRRSLLRGSNKSYSSHSV